MTLLTFGPPRTEIWGIGRTWRDLPFLGAGRNNKLMQQAAAAAAAAAAAVTPTDIGIFF